MEYSLKSKIGLGQETQHQTHSKPVIQHLVQFIVPRPGNTTGILRNTPGGRLSHQRAGCSKINIQTKAIDFHFNTQSSWSLKKRPGAIQLDPTYLQHTDHELIPLLYLLRFCSRIWNWSWHLTSKEQPGIFNSNALVARSASDRCPSGRMIWDGLCADFSRKLKGCVWEGALVDFLHRMYSLEECIQVTISRLRMGKNNKIVEVSLAETAASIYGSHSCRPNLSVDWIFFCLLNRDQFINTKGQPRKSNVYWNISEAWFWRHFSSQ